MNSIVYFIREAFKGFFRNRATALGSVITIFLSLLILGVFSVGAVVVGNVVDSVESKVSITAYVADDAKEKQIQKVESYIEGLDGVASVSFTTKDQALENFKKSMTSNPDIVEQLDGQNPLPASIDVELSEEGYVFGFDNLKRWIDLCSECGVRYFEMSHLFSQWGAKHPPKVMANKDGELVKIFGWHTPAVGEYTGFLESFLPQLIEKLREWGIAERVFFHISDEPLGDLDGYNAAKSSLGNLLDGFRSMDAVSCYEIYERGIVDIPIPGNNELDDFIANEVPDQWTYYCTGQFLDVSNRFMAMPSARNRIYGVQLYKYNIVGILHWGYNFYNSQYSISRINPYAVTDAGGAFPSGDPFLVYPGSDGMPEESIRMMVHYQALTDLRALQMLERLAGRDFVMDLIEGDLGEPLTFTRYPKSDMYLISLRNRVNREIAKRAGE